MGDGRDPNQADPAVLEELLQALLETAAKKDARHAWLDGATVDAGPPPVQARRDDDGTLGVFRFYTLVDKDPRPLTEMTPQQARAQLEGLGDERLRAGDEIGVELPLSRIAAIALADVEATLAAAPSASRSSTLPSEAKPSLLPARITGMLLDEVLAQAVVARLSALRGPPPHVPLRQLVTDFGGQSVVWTAVSAGEQAELCVHVVRGDESRLVVVPAATSACGHTQLLRALSPPPPERSLWRFLELEGPALLAGSEGALWSDDALGRRLSLEIGAIAVARDPTVYGVARARARLLTWAGDRIVDEVAGLVALPIDLPRLVDVPWPEGATLERVRAAARDFREKLQRRLSALVDARAPTPADALEGCAFLRVVARAAADVTLTGVEEAEPCALSSEPEPADDDAGDVLVLRVARFGALELSVAESVLRARPTGQEAVEIFGDGALVDGDAEAFAALATRLADALAQSDADVELSFADPEAEPADAEADPGNEAGADAVDAPAPETMLLSEWLRGLGRRDRAQMRWPPRPAADLRGPPVREAAAVLHTLVDRFVDRGPLATS
jgi:hypothetical protein